ncbi:MAG: DUF2339 domain-containing protein [Ignavibacteriae bacterium]|nr:DUF2339 domain-containing protein [Ignavibacteriota bacterium]
MEILLGLFGIAVVISPFVLGFVNFSRIGSLMKRIEQLEVTLMRYSVEVDRLRKAEAVTVPTPQPATSEPAPPLREPEVIEEKRPIEVPTEIPVAPQPPVEPTLVVKPTDVQQPAAAPQPSAPAQVPSFRKPGKSRNEWEALIGGRILNRIGALALIIGMGFFLKYAFDNNWINETMRVALGGIAGGGLVVFAARTHKKGFEVFSQGLVGAGISILYLSVYAAFNFYHIVPQLVAFVLMSGVTMLALWQGLKYDSLAVALLGWAGGFLTPFMLSTGEANAVGLFTYIALLVAGLLTILLVKQKWTIIEPLTFAATYAIYFLWFDAAYKPESRAAAIFFVTLFWALFFGFEAARNLRKIDSALVLRHVLAVANGFLFYIGLYQLLEPELHSWTGIVTLMVGVPYFLLFSLLRKRTEMQVELLSRYILGNNRLLVHGNGGAVLRIHDRDILVHRSVGSGISGFEMEFEIDVGRCGDDVRHCVLQTRSVRWRTHICSPRRIPASLQYESASVHRSCCCDATHCGVVCANRGEVAIALRQGACVCIVPGSVHRCHR